MIRIDCGDFVGAGAGSNNSRRSALIAKPSFAKNQRRRHSPRLRGIWRRESLRPGLRLSISGVWRNRSFCEGAGGCVGWGGCAGGGACWELDGCLSRAGFVLAPLLFAWVQPIGLGENRARAYFTLPF